MGGTDPRRNGGSDRGFGFPGSPRPGATAWTRAAPGAGPRAPDVRAGVRACGAAPMARTAWRRAVTAASPSRPRAMRTSARSRPRSGNCRNPRACPIRPDTVSTTIPRIRQRPRRPPVSSAVSWPPAAARLGRSPPCRASGARRRQPRPVRSPTAKTPVRHRRRSAGRGPGRRTAPCSATPDRIAANSRTDFPRRRREVRRVPHKPSRTPVASGPVALWNRNADAFGGRRPGAASGKPAGRGHPTERVSPTVNSRCRRGDGVGTGLFAPIPGLFPWQNGQRAMWT